MIRRPSFQRTQALRNMGYKVTVLPTVSRGAALSSRSMNGRIEEVEAALMPRSANKSANAGRSKVTGISAGGDILGASYEDLNP